MLHHFSGSCIFQINEQMAVLHKIAQVCVVGSCVLLGISIKLLN